MEEKAAARVMTAQAAFDGQPELALKKAKPWAEVISAKVDVCREGGPEKCCCCFLDRTMLATVFTLCADQLSSMNTKYKWGV